MGWLASSANIVKFPQFLPQQISPYGTATLMMILLLGTMDGTNCTFTLVHIRLIWSHPLTIRWREECRDPPCFEWMALIPQ